MRRLKLNGSFQNNIEPQRFARGGLAYTPTLEEESQQGIDLNNYLLPEIQTPPLPLQPMPNAQVLQKQGSGGTMYQGLTPAENAYLSEEEKMIRLRDRGLV